MPRQPVPAAPPRRESPNAMLRAVTSPLLAGVLIAWASAADAITYGQRDCTDNATNALISSNRQQAPLTVLK